MIEAMSRPSFAATSAAGRLLLVLAALLAAVAVVAFSSGLRTQPERHSRVLTRPPDVVVGQDAAGCPNSGDCTVGSGVPATLLDAVRQRFPKAVVQWQSSSTTTDPDGNQAPQRLIALFLLDGRSDTLFVNAECQPGSSRLTDRRESSSAQQRSDLAGNQISLLTIREIVVSGPPGCSSDLILDAIGDGSQYESGMQSLSADSAIQARL
jgi:hypothetical protein